MRPLSAAVHTRIKEQFPLVNHAEVETLLVQYDGKEIERVQLAILDLSKGDLAMIAHYVKQANQDYRDILYWAELDKNS